MLTITRREHIHSHLTEGVNAATLLLELDLAVGEWNERVGGGCGMRMGRRTFGRRRTFDSPTASFGSRTGVLGDDGGFSNVQIDDEDD